MAAEGVFAGMRALGLAGYRWALPRISSLDLLLTRWPVYMMWLFCLHCFDTQCLLASGRASSLNKIRVMRCWHGYLSGARSKWFAYGAADATTTSLSLASLKSRMMWPFWCQLTQVVPEKRPLNGCCIHNVTILQHSNFQREMTVC